VSCEAIHGRGSQLNLIKLLQADLSKSNRRFHMKHPMIFAIAGVNSFTSRKAAAASSHHDGAETSRLGWGTRFLSWCARCSERSRQRQALAELDDHHLKDIGKTRQEAMAEAAKPFWK
jgi:uncharacterized protein YjiS (DUF1127 family)